jgi:hypothetical protein
LLAQAAVANKQVLAWVAAETEALGKLTPSFAAATTGADERIKILAKDAEAIAGAVVEGPIATRIANYDKACSKAAEDHDAAHLYVTEVMPWDTEVEKLCRKSCPPQGTFCIEATTGDAFCRNSKGLVYETVPEPIGAGATLAVRVMGLSDTGGSYEVTTASAYSSDSLFATGAAKAPTGPGVKALGGTLTVPTFVQLNKVDQSIPIGSDRNLQSVTIAYRWTPGEKDERPAASRQYRREVDHGRYYLEVGLLVPVVFGGTRTVTPTLLPGTGGQQRLTVSSDSIVTPALALNIFPGGRRNGRVAASGYRDLWGVQFAVDLDLKHAFDRFYIGLALEPIAGLSFNAGLATVKGQYVPGGYAANMIVAKGETFTPDSVYMPRPYLGLTVTNEILTSLAGAAKAINSNSP